MNPRKVFRKLCQIRPWIGLLVLCAGCVAEVEPLPTEVTVAATNKAIDRAAQPPLYQLIYDYAFLPEVQRSEQRVRILVWLKLMKFSDYQLRALSALHEEAARERRRIEEAQEAVVRDYEPRLAPVYDDLWEKMKAGADPSDAELEDAAAALLTERLQHSREKELLQLRAQGVRAVLTASQEWLVSLDHEQEALLTDSLGFLRHRLDPYANYGDFRALVGTLFVAGDYGTLNRGNFEPEEDHLNLGNLWTDQSLSERQGPTFNGARRTLILYMILMEPTLPEAIQAALGGEEGAPPGPDDQPVDDPPEQPSTP